MVSAASCPIPRFRWVIGCLLLLFHLAPAVAQPSEVLPCSPETRSDVASDLKLLRSSDQRSRLDAAADLGRLGKDALPGLMAAIPGAMEHNAESNSWPPAELDFASLLTDVIRAILSDDTRAILQFRACTTAAITKPLIWAARGDNQRLRVNSANILANVIDNTTVCFVLHHLRDRMISTAGRANLLGVTNSMASYAYKENVASITETVNIVFKQIGDGMGFEQTRAIIRDITSRMAKSENKGTPLGGLGKYCANYDFNAVLD